MGITIGEIISFLKYNDGFVDFFISDCGSYRGYHSELYIDLEYDNGSKTSNEVISFFKENVIDVEFTGYKGGTYTMTLDTTVFIDSNGDANNSYIEELSFDEDSGEIKFILNEN